MNRRNFIGTLVGGLAASAAVRTWPFRVYSFPSKPMLWLGADPAFDDPMAQYAVMQLWGNAIGFDKPVLLAQSPIVDGKPIDFSIPSGVWGLGFEAKIPNGQTMHIPSINLRMTVDR